MDVPRLLIFSGAVLVIAGLVLWLAMRAGLGRLPGDIFIQRGDVQIAFPVVTSIVVSIVLTIVLNVAVRLWR